VGHLAPDPNAFEQTTSNIDLLRDLANISESALERLECEALD